VQARCQSWYERGGVRHSIRCRSPRPLGRQSDQERGHRADHWSYGWRLGGEAAAGIGYPLPMTTLNFLAYVTSATFAPVPHSRLFAPSFVPARRFYLKCDGNVIVLEARKGVGRGDLARRPVARARASGCPARGNDVLVAHEPPAFFFALGLSSRKPPLADGVSALLVRRVIRLRRRAHPAASNVRSPLMQLAKTRRSARPRARIATSVWCPERFPRRAADGAPTAALRRKARRPVLMVSCCSAAMRLA